MTNLIDQIKHHPEENKASKDPILAVIEDNPICAILFTHKYCKLSEKFLNGLNEALPSLAIPVFYYDMSNTEASVVQSEIKGTPTFVLYKNGTEINRLSGLCSYVNFGKELTLKIKL